jgi:hypothetical protein
MADGEGFDLLMPLNLNIKLSILPLKSNLNRIYPASSFHLAFIPESVTILVTLGV